MFGDGRLADPEPVDQLADAAFGAAELVEDPAPGGLGEDGEDVDGHPP